MRLALTRRRWLVALLGLALALAVPAYMKWREASNRGGQKPAEPFRIAGNLYYVGANDATAFLLTGPEGHVLINGGYPGTPPMIIESIAKLGFDIADVQILLVGERHRRDRVQAVYRQKHRIRAGGDRQPRAPFAADAVAPWPAQGQGRA